MKTQKKGVALIWTLILCTILIITSSTMVSYIIKESQFSVRIEESAQVYAAAKSGTEWGKWYIENNGDPGIYNFDFLDPGTGNETTVEITAITGGYEISSTSNYRNVTRKIKYKLVPTGGSIITPSTVYGILAPTSLGDNSESFGLQFDFWNGPSFKGFSLGATDTITGNKIYFDLTDAGAIKVKGVIAGISHESAQANPSLFVANSTPYSYRATIKYIENTAARITVTKRDLTNPLHPAYLCVGSADLDLTGLEFGNLKNLYITTTSGNTLTYVTNGTIGDGRYIAVNYNSIIRDYIDNIYIKK